MFKSTKLNRVLREENLAQLKILQEFSNFAKAPKQEALLEHSLRTTKNLY